MNEFTWTQSQARRFRELGKDLPQIPGNVSDKKMLNQYFQKMEKKEVKALRSRLSNQLATAGKTHMTALEDSLVLALAKEGFTRVSTPTIISKAALKKMTIDHDHPLSKQVFWLNDKQCLRPMLAPNLYSLMIDFGRLPQRPVRFFEMGPCFRKETDGAKHTSEFTMLNLVEMGLPEQDRQKRLEHLAATIMSAADISDYEFENETSEVYNSTLDVVAGPERVEVASGAMGPHPLDTAWGITDTWVGMGFGVERVLMIARQDTSIGRWKKSLFYFNGIGLNI